MEVIMSENENDLFKELSDAVVRMEEDRARQLATEAVDRRIDAYVAIDRGLVDGMSRAGELFESEEYFIPELLLCSDAMYAGLDVLRPHLKIEDASQRRFKIVMGVVEGDTHDIGKNLVKIMLEASGFDVIDLGRDIPPERFVETAISENADVIALSTLMTTTMDAMAEVVERLQRTNLRERFKVIVGGGPISQAFADRIHADGYASSAPCAVKLVKQLAGVLA
jgi:corrinoid protein of di/trimethylamine methyltransferase